MKFPFRLSLASFFSLAVSLLAAAPVAVVSPAIRQSVSASGASYLPALSADGSHVVFVSNARNLVSNDDRLLHTDIFVRDLITSNTVLVSVSTNGVGGANANAVSPSISSNGQFVAFASAAENLVPGDTNGVEDIFVRDIVAGTTRLVSVDVSGNFPVKALATIPNGSSSSPSISQDGRYVFFESYATNLVTNASPNGFPGIFRRDLWSNETVVVNIGLSNVVLTNQCAIAQVTGDGRFALFASMPASGWFDSPTQAFYLRDVQLGQTIWASTNFTYPLGLVMDATARYIALVDITPSSQRDYFGSVYHLDRETGATNFIGVATNLDAGLFISADGHTVAFTQPSASGAQAVRWTQSGGLEVLAAGFVAALSGDGRTIGIICTNDQLLVTNVVSGWFAAAPLNGAHAETEPAWVQLSLGADGGLCAFASDLPLVPNDLNREEDIFLFRTNSALPELLTSAAPGHSSVVGASLPSLSSAALAPNGSFLIYDRTDDPAVINDTNGARDLFLFDRASGASRVLSVDTNTYTDGGGQPYLKRHNYRFGAVASSANASTIAAEARDFKTRANDIVICRPGGATEVLTNHFGRVSGRNPVLSSDGRLLIYEAGQQIMARLERTAEGSNIVSHYEITPTGAGGCSNAVLSADGRWLVFLSSAASLVPTNFNSMPLQVFVAELGTDASSTNYLVNPPTRWLSRFPSNWWVAVETTKPVISGNSRYAFYSVTNAIFRSDLLSASSAPELVCTNCRRPSVSSDGNVVAYERVRTIDFYTGIVDLYAVDMRLHREELVAVTPSGAPPSHTSLTPLISASGRFVVFQSKATNVVLADTNRFNDIYARDRLLGVTLWLSPNIVGAPASAPSTRPMMSADGQTIVFQSAAADLVSHDYNASRDIFMVTLESGDTDGDGMDDDWEVTYFGNISRDGSGDFDADGVPDRAEFMAGTDPTNTESVFRVLTLDSIGDGSRRLIWTGNPSRAFRVEYKDDMNSTSWSTLNVPVSWSGNNGMAIDANAQPSRYYRVVRLP